MTEREWYAVISPPKSGEWSWRWGVNNHKPSAREAESAILFGSKWGYALTERGAAKKARRWLRWMRWVDSRRGTGQSQVISLEDRTEEELQREFDKLHKELKRRKANT